ncbi:protein WVD2-like 1-like, partial [Trifolium medium]|nr:protein WVD2-like 1-like [Trifolium medium]
LALAYASRFRTASVGIRAGLPCFFRNLNSHGRSTNNQGKGFTTALTALNVQIAALTIQLNNNANANNIMINNNNNFRRHHRGKGHVASKLAAAKFETKEHEVKECTEINLFVENVHETNDVLAAKTTNSDSDLPEDESENHEVQKIGDNEELNSIKLVADIEAGDTKKNESYTHIVDIEAVAT